MVRQITQRPEKFIEKIKKGQSYWKANNNNDMKFNAIVGNPPYQEMDGGNSESSKPIYNEFVDIAKKIKPNFISLIMPARWYAGGKGLDSFRENMLNDKRMSNLFDFPNSNDCFTNVDVAGGLCYFLWDSNHSDDCIITNNINGEIVSAKRPINEFGILIRDNKAIPILHKVLAWNKRNKTLAERVSSRKPFGLPTNYNFRDKGIPCWFIQKIGLQYADENDITDKFGILDKWKILIPKSPIAGQTDFTKPVGFYYDGNVRIAKPGECCTESFIVAGAFDTEKEVQSFKSYLFTKVVRFLLLQMVISQDVTKRCFGFIPDFEKYEGSYSDSQLCKLWGITEVEWEYIDSRINNIKGN
jgi:site-specific DNA-methyltransferase (adenine-specific)